MKKLFSIVSAVIVSGIGLAAVAQNLKEQKEAQKSKYARIPFGLYEKYVKRPLDAVLAAGAVIALSPIISITALFVKKKLGSPVLFTQDRPGLIDPESGEEKVFKLYKFRTMTNERDEEGNLLPDEKRLTKFGKMLRNTSIDELPELINIIKGDMSIIGPRPQLVRDMVFMTQEERKRHTVRPGLSGLAQIRGRNAISWEEKLSSDLEYIQRITLVDDVKIIIQTLKKVFTHDKANLQETDITADYGVDLLSRGKITKEEFNIKQREAREFLLREQANPKMAPINDYKKYSVLMSLYKKENPKYLKRAFDSIITQTVKPDEIVLVEDGPLTKELYTVVEEYKALYPGLFQIIVNKQNMGLGHSLNKGLKICQNELVARMDTDDIAIPDRCEKQLEYFRTHLETAIVGGQIEEFIGEENHIVGKRIVPLTNEELKEWMKKRCPFNHMTVMFRKSSVLMAGNYQDWFWNEDYYMWIRLADKKYIFANIPDTLVRVRVGADMYQRRGGLKYFNSEAAIQKLMLQKKIISIPRYIINIVERFILQIMMPNFVREIVYKAFARE